MKTYTYTARNEQDPNKVITFTLDGEYLKVNLTGLSENLGKLIRKDSADEDQAQLGIQTAPVAIKVLEEITGPVHINDVSGKWAGSSNDNFQITIWNRIGGLRAVPFILNLGTVDNPKGAQQFLDELAFRKKEAGKTGILFGPFDYWLGWIGVVLLGLFLFRFRQQPRFNNS